MKNLIKRIVDTICIIIIFCLVVFEILQFTHCIYVLQVKTGSMENKIHVGDYIIITKDNNYKEGDIVTYFKNDKYITHRIVKVYGNKITTKGDANSSNDEPINKNMIIGKYIYRSTFLNYIITYRFILSGIALLLFLISCLINTKNEETKDESQEENKEEII